MLIRDEHDLDTWRREWRAFHVAMALAEVGVFEALQGGAVAIDELAGRLKIDARALEITARTIAARGLLVLDGDRLRLSTAGAAMGPVLTGLKGDLGEVPALSTLASHVRSGQPVRRTHGGVVEEDAEGARRFLGMLHRRSERAASESAATMREVCAGIDRPRILDIGGGHGRYAAAFATRIPGAAVTLFDRAVVLPIAREFSGEGFAGRAGDFLTDDLGGPYDVAFLSNVVHGEGREGCVTLLRRVRAVASRVVVKDLFLDDAGSGPERAADFGLQMLMYTAAGRSWGRGEMAEMLKETGFARVRAVELVGEGFGFVIGG